MLGGMSDELERIEVLLPRLSKTRDEVLERLDEAEDLLAERLHVGRTARELARRWQCAPRDARAYVAVVKRRWDLEADMEGGRAGRRTQVRNTLQLVVERAMADEDHKNVISAISLLCDLDGLKEQKEHSDIGKLFEALQKLPKNEIETKALTKDLRDV